MPQMVNWMVQVMKYYIPNHFLFRNYTLKQAVDNASGS